MTAPEDAPPSVTCKTRSRWSSVVERLPLITSAILNASLSVALPVSLSVMFLDWQNHFRVSRAQTAMIHSTCVGMLFAAGILPGYDRERERGGEGRDMAIERK